MYQSEFNFTGQQLRDAGMQMAVDHADAVNEGWSIKAYNLFVAWIKNKGRGRQFKTEDFRVYLKLGELLPNPPSERAYGSIALKAAKAGLIKKVGYATVVNPKAHGTPCTLWEVV